MLRNRLQKLQNGTKFDSNTYQKVKDEIEKRNSEEDESLHVKYVIPSRAQRFILARHRLRFMGHWRIIISMEDKWILM